MRAQLGTSVSRVVKFFREQPLAVAELVLGLVREQVSDRKQAAMARGNGRRQAAKRAVKQTPKLVAVAVKPRRRKTRKARAQKIVQKAALGSGVGTPPSVAAPMAEAEAPQETAAEMPKRRGRPRKAGVSPEPPAMPDVKPLGS